MASSPSQSPTHDSSASSPLIEHPAADDATTLSESGKQAEEKAQQDKEEVQLRSHSLSPPAEIPPFDWDDFEARYEKALQEADEQEKEILKETEGLSKYFRAWAAAASAHDDDRALKRLRTRQRFVNLSEENLTQKQKHYEEVVRAFESALALLRST